MFLIITLVVLLLKYVGLFNLKVRCRANLCKFRCMCVHVYPYLHVIKFALKMSDEIAAYQA